MTANTPDDARLLPACLLGSEGPELTCDECFDVLDAYVERELAAADPDAALPAMRAHLAGCSACREDHDSLLALLRNGFGA
jgi:hypothetical protein